jgi:hypothetical protein
MYSMAAMYVAAGACWAFVDPSQLLKEIEPAPSGAVA